MPSFLCVHHVIQSSKLNERIIGLFEIGKIITFISWMRKLRLRKVKQLAQDHTAIV